jgi:hypothetical protein
MQRIERTTAPGAEKPDPYTTLGSSEAGVIKAGLDDSFRKKGPDSDFLANLGVMHCCLYNHVLSLLFRRCESSE